MRTRIDTLSLSEPMLRQVSYHWFWGLYLGSYSQHSTLYSSIEVLRRDPEQLDGIRAKQEQVDSYHPALRYFFWLFNISNYAADGYVLSGYKALQLHEAQRAPLRLSNEPDTRWANLSYCLSWAGQRLYQVLYNEIKREQARAQPAPVLSPVERPLSVVTSFKVTEAMIEHFRVLGQEVVIGQNIGMDKFKALSRARFLETHPDKGGARDAFIKAKRATDTISRLLKGHDASDATAASYEEQYGELWENIVKLHREEGMSWEKAAEHAMKETICELLVERLDIMRETTAIILETNTRIETEIIEIRAGYRRLVAALTAAGLMPAAEVPESTGEPAVVVHIAASGGPGFFSPTAGTAAAAGAGVGMGIELPAARAGAGAGAR